jgi:hypothetical protein
MANEKQINKTCPSYARIAEAWAKKEMKAEYASLISYYKKGSKDEVFRRLFSDADLISAIKRAYIFVIDYPHSDALWIDLFLETSKGCLIEYVLFRFIVRTKGDGNREIHGETRLDETEA